MTLDYSTSTVPATSAVHLSINKQATVSWAHTLLNSFFRKSAFATHCSITQHLTKKSSILYGISSPIPDIVGAIWEFWLRYIMHQFKLDAHWPKFMKTCKWLNWKIVYILKCTHTSDIRKFLLLWTKSFEWLLSVSIDCWHTGFVKHAFSTPPTKQLQYFDSHIMSKYTFDR